MDNWQFPGKKSFTGRETCTGTTSEVIHRLGNLYRHIDESHSQAVFVHWSKKRIVHRDRNLYSDLRADAGKKKLFKISDGYGIL